MLVYAWEIYTGKISFVLNGRINRTYVSTSAALNALVCVYNVFAVFFGNAAYRTFFRTCTACDAFICYFICQNVTSVFLYIAIVSQKI